MKTEAEDKDRPPFDLPQVTRALEWIAVPLALFAALGLLAAALF